jgi:hypothetical protein
VGATAVLNEVMGRKTPSLRRESNPRLRLTYHGSYCVGCAVWNDRIIMNVKVKKTLKEVFMAYFKFPSLHFLGDIEENRDITQSCLLISEPRYEFESTEYETGVVTTTP